MPTPNLSLVLGIDGGATSTVALLADAATGGALGRGTGGPSNIHAVGIEAAVHALEAAVAAAFRAANQTPTTVAAATLGLAGVDLDGVGVIRAWADHVQLAEKVSIANDATLLFAAGTPDGWGLAMVAGTGSIAFTLGKDGKTARTGGWGYLLGDEGSAYRMGLLGIRAACRSADGITPPTKLLPALLEKFGITDPRDMIPVVYGGKWDKAAIAGLAPLVLELATDDQTAASIMEQQALELAKTAAGAVTAGRLPPEGIPIALTGGLLLRSEPFRTQFLEHLRGYGITPGPVGLVEDPAIGAVTLARKLLS
ncbi:MAG: BadF/BadG/BcrA/BcrD type ATPase [Planctomycetes bacterium]|nr:BadF/BadG/BcrA/BcrD type ATPase [Planctomycetota bacterium]